MKFLRKTALALTFACAAASTFAEGWPAGYEGVMLQGFYWDSYADTKWSMLESKADSYSKHFKLIWIPNSGHCGDGNQMGYMPQYWFTNHNSSFGTESELRSMISTYKAKDTGIIADVVINHRNGVNGWYDFPVEQWNGRTWQIGLDGICCNDNLANAPGQPKPTGNYDTGDLFDGCRDLDHTNANVQDNCKNYCKFLLEDLGYAGFRYDMVKGYSGEYTKIYNQYSKPTYSVGEYWDASYDRVKEWIDATGKESAAFDFPFKYAVNQAFASNDMSQLVWMANGTNPQPAGMIHFGYAQYSVTFIENHDTYRDGSRFNGNVAAANAFMLCSPGTPCVFLPHYQQYTDEINRLIDARNSVGISNTSTVTVLRHDRDCYMAEVTGSKGKLAVKIGSAFVSPEGYADSQIVTSGQDYCVWTTTGSIGGGDDDDVVMPDRLYVAGNLPTGSWTTDKGIEMEKEGTSFTAKNVTLEIIDSDKEEPFAYFSFLTRLGDNWDAVNASDRYGAETTDCPLTDGGSAKMVKYGANTTASSSKAWKVEKGTYDIRADFKSMTVSITANQGGSGDDDDTEKTIYFDNTLSGWEQPLIYYWSSKGSPLNPAVTYPGTAMMKVEYEDNMWVFTCPPKADGILFNAGGNGDDTKTPDFTAVHNHVYSINGDQGLYTPTGIQAVGSDSYVNAVYFNLQGIRVNNPRPGEIYLKVTPVRTSKVRF